MTKITEYDIILEGFCSVADPYPGSGIRCLLDSWIREPGWVKKSRSGSGMNIPDHISESLETFFLVKILKFFDVDPGILFALDPGSRM